jgi:hypothetical protein
MGGEFVPNGRLAFLWTIQIANSRLGSEPLIFAPFLPTSQTEGSTQRRQQLAGHHVGNAAMRSVIGALKMVARY